MTATTTNSISPSPAKPAPPITIRTATAADAERIGHIGRTVFAASFGHSMAASDMNIYLEQCYSPESVLADIASGTKTVAVACDNHDNTVLGFAVLTEDSMEDCIRHLPAPVEVQRVYVDGVAHGRGIGGALVEFLEGVAREKGKKTAWLGVWEENFKAQRVYARLGYRHVGSHDFVMGTEVQTDWVWAKEL